MSTLFEYALLRVVPRVERGEFIKTGVVLHCPEAGFLDARVPLEPKRLSAPHPRLDPTSVLAHREATRLVCAGGRKAGPINLLTRSQRFGWIVAPRSTIVQPSPVHNTGFATDPEEAIEHLPQVRVCSPA